MNCYTCKFAVLEDYGYSNYTTEGTNFRCGIKKHPDDQFDAFYGEEKRLDFGLTCVNRIEGEPVRIDCDQELVEHLSFDEKAIYEGFYKVD